jgi:hypothetical protein
VLSLQRITKTDRGMILTRKQLPVAIPVHAGSRAVQHAYRGFMRLGAKPTA